jgi:hypothetical protein
MPDNEVVGSVGIGQQHYLEVHILVGCRGVSRVGSQANQPFGRPRLEVAPAESVKAGPDLTRHDAGAVELR